MRRWLHVAVEQKLNARTEFTSVILAEFAAIGNTNCAPTQTSLLPKFIIIVITIIIIMVA